MPTHSPPVLATTHLIREVKVEVKSDNAPTHSPRAAASNHLLIRKALSKDTSARCADALAACSGTKSPNSEVRVGFGVSGVPAHTPYVTASTRLLISEVRVPTHSPHKRHLHTY